MPTVGVTNNWSNGDGPQWGIMLEISRGGGRDAGERGHPKGPRMGCSSLPTYQFLKEKHNDHRARWKRFNRTLLFFFPSEIAKLLNPSCFAQADFKDAVTNLRQVTGPSAEAGSPQPPCMGSILGLFPWEGGDGKENVVH